MQELQVKTPGVISAANLTADYSHRFLDFLDVKPKTLDTYRKALKSLFAFFWKNNIQRPERADIVLYRNELRALNKASTVKTYMTVARLFFRWLDQEGLYKNIADRVKGAKVEHGHKRDALTVGQVKDAIKTCDNARDYAIFCLMIVCGLRTIEVSRANIGDMKTLGNTVVLYIQGKGKDEKSEYVVITREVEKAIRSYLLTRPNKNFNSPLFASDSNNSKGKQLSTRTISGIIKKCLRAAGLDSDRLTAHSLRHTAVTLSLLGGSSLQEASQFARHSSISTTEIYAHNLERLKNPCEDIIANYIF